MTPPNVLAYCAQIAIVVALCAGLPRLLGLRSPAVHYAFWRLVLAVCLALPLLQPWRPVEMVFVPAPAPPAAAARVAPPAAPSGPASHTPPRDWTGIARAIILIGIGGRLFWVALGAARLRSLRRRAADAPAGGFDDVQHRLGTSAQILWSSDVRHPVTFGVVQPIVLLPLALRTADPAAQRAVLAHELNHVRRRDWVWVIVEEVIRSVFWFHPAMWWLVSRVQLARETVVDELSILVTNARRTYLDTLLAFADDTGLVSPPAFSARRHLFYRVMLLSKEGGMSSIRVAVASIVLTLALVAGAWEAVQAFPLHATSIAAEHPAAAQQAPPRDPISLAELQRRTVECFEHASKDASLTPDQKLEWIQKGLSYADRALAREPNYVDAMVYKSILLRLQANLTTDPQAIRNLLADADELRDRALVLRRAGAGFTLPADPLAGTPPPPPPPPPPPLAGTVVEPSPEFKATLDRLKPIQIGGNMKAPIKIHDVKPVYPDIAQASKAQGVIILEAIIDPHGNVADARVLRPIPLLDDAALDAVRQWKFAPTLLNGAPVSVLVTVTMNFTLQ